MRQVVCPVMVGRQRELELAEALLETALEGRGQLLVVSGEAGVGKSRLALAIASRGTERGATVITGACLEQLRSLPYWPAAELVRALVSDLQPTDAAARLRAVDACLLRLLPELDTPDGANATAADLEPGRLAIAVCTLLDREARARPLVVLLEDLHWADAATIDLVAVVGQRVERSPTLVVATHRSDETATRADLLDVLTQLRGRGLSTDVELAGLDASEVEAMIRAILDDREPMGDDAVAAIHGRSDGNPFYVEELLRTLLEADGHGDAWRAETIAELETPPPVQDAILRRVRRLPSDVRSLLDVAAVLGGPFELESLSATSGLAGERLLELVRTLVEQQLLVEEPASGAFRFRHALTRETVYAQLLVTERRLVHTRIAAGLERLHESDLDEHAAEIAHHHEAALNDDRARELAVRAARRASSLGALGDAKAHYATALRLATDPRTRFELLFASGRLAHTLGDVSTAIGELGEAASSAERAGDRRAQARALLDLAWAELMSGNRPRALELRLSVLDLLEEEGECEELAWAYRGLGHQHMVGSSNGEAVQWCERAIELGRSLGAEALVVTATVDLASALPHVGELDRGVDLLRQCLETARGEVVREALRAAVNLSYNLILFGRYAEAIEVCREGIALSEGSGNEFIRQLCQANLAAGLRLVGRWGEAEAEATAVMTAGYALGSNKFLLISLCELAAVRADQGRWEEARTLRDEAEPVIRERGELQGLAPLWHVSARIADAQGDPERALRDLEDARGFWRTYTDDSVLIAPVLALGVQLAADRTEAESWLDDLERVADRSLSPEPAVLLDEACGAVRSRQRDPEGAAALARAAAAWERLGRPYDTARALRLEGEALLALGEREAAVEPLRRALSLGRSLGAAEEARLAAALLRRAGERVPRGPRPSTRRGPGGLTRRELEVARLVSQGRTNAEIARTLVIARKTAATHVSHILGKLGFGSRAEIARWVAEHDANAAPKAPAGAPR